MVSLLRTSVITAFLFLALAPAAGAWTWPAPGPVLAGFHLGDNPYAGGQHRGIDIGGAAGSPVLAPRGGTVTFAGAVATSGLSVAIATPDGYSVTLVHLGSIAVRRNTEVAEGAVVGTIGPTGVAAHPEPYVFLGVRISADPNGYLHPLGSPPLRPPTAPPAPKPAPAPPPAAAPPPAGSAAPKPPPAPPAAAAPEPVAAPAPQPAAVPA